MTFALIGFVDCVELKFRFASDSSWTDTKNLTISHSWANKLSDTFTGRTYRRCKGRLTINQRNWCLRTEGLIF